MADITRKDWVAKTGEEQVAIADAIFAKLNKASKYAYQQGYTNSFIGVRSGVKPCNFFTVIPQKKAALLSIRVQQSAENDKLVEQVSKSGVKYTNGWYAISFASAEGSFFVMVSTNYAGDVTTATWTELNIGSWPEPNSSWVFEGASADMSSFVGQNVTIAFKYTSTTDVCPAWEVKNVVVE